MQAWLLWYMGQGQLVLAAAGQWDTHLGLNFHFLTPLCAYVLFYVILGSLSVLAGHQEVGRSL